MDLEISAEILRSKNISLGFSFLSLSSLAHLDRHAIFLNSSSVTIFDFLEMYGLQLKKGRGKKSVDFLSWWNIQNFGDIISDLKTIKYPGHAQSVS